MKLLSVTIPSYNSQDYMEHCIESLLPSGEDVEIIVVDDGSTDRTAEIADAYAEKYPTIVKAVHQENGGHGEAVNAGTGKELSIKQLAELVAEVIGYQGEILWDTTKPNGTPRKLLDVGKAEKLGWHYKTELEEGIRLSYEDFLCHPMRAER